MGIITAVIVSYKREENLPKIIESLKSDLIEEIIVFNNNPDKQIEVKGAIVINSQKNWRCWAKYIVSQMVKTEWVLSMDDDIMFGKDGLNILFEATRGDLEGIYGLFGVNLINGSYSKGKRIVSDKIKEKRSVDILLGRVILCKTEKMALATYSRSLIAGYRDKHYLFDEGEDIILTLANKRSGFKNYVIPSSDDLGFINLSELGQSLYKRKSHMNNRDLAVKDFFK
jgi:glycosyltransferase involved in cell wall biosynthesis